MADPGSGPGGPDADSQAAGAAAAGASSGSASSGMSDNFGTHDDSFGQTSYGGPDNLGGLSQDHIEASYNAVNQITATNPYGKQGFFSRVLGIDPNNIDYSKNMNLSTRLSIANNQFSKYANPTNTPGQLGYNRDFAPAPPGQLRAGAQKAGFQTAYGPVMAQAREQSVTEMGFRGLAGLFGGLPGMALGQIGTQEYGLPGQPGFEGFNPDSPNPSGGFLGSVLGGMNPSQAKDAFVGAFAPTAPAPAPISMAFGGIVDTSESLHPLTGERSTPHTEDLDTAEQYAQVDYSNLRNVGGNIYRAGSEKSALDKVLESLGMKEADTGPSGQIYGSSAEGKTFFDYLGFDE